MVARLALRPSGRHALPAIALPRKSSNRLRLLVAIPEAQREQRYHVAARQLEGKEELGRVTWVLAAKGKA